MLFRSLLRDCQASLIEDGENNILGLNAVGLLSRSYTSTTGRTLAGVAH